MQPSILVQAIIGIVASIVAYILVLLAPTAVSIFSGNVALIDITLSSESIDRYQVVKISGENNGNFPLNPIEVKNVWEDRVVCAVALAREAPVVNCPPTLGNTLWIGKLGIGEKVTINVIVNGASPAIQLDQLVLAEYAQISSGGEIVQSRAIVRDEQQRASDWYEMILKIGLTIFGVLAVIGLSVAAWWRWRKKPPKEVSDDTRSQEERPPPAG